MTTTVPVVLRSPDPRSAVLAELPADGTVTLARVGKDGTLHLSGTAEAVRPVLDRLKRSGALGGLAYASAFAATTRL